MYEINSATERYETFYLLDRTTDSCVTVVPERGGIVTGIRIGDRELLYLDRDRFANPQLSVRGGIPILFPICGNLPDNLYVWEGKTYSLPQHGFGRTLPWNVISTSQPHQRDGASLTLTLTHSRETLAVYPFEFAVEFTYRWANLTLSVDQKFKNYSDRIMPFSVGFHPYFSVMNKELLKFNLPAQNYYDRANDISSQFLGKWDTRLDEIDAAFEPIENGTSLEAVASDGDYQVTISASPTFRYLVYWSLKEKPFYCLEPWSAPRNSMNTGTDLIRLEPGVRLQTELSFEFQIKPSL